MGVSPHTFMAWIDASLGASPHPSLQVTTTRSFDTESPSSSYATGFVVDKKRGIILTNRHVVKPAPVIAEVMGVENVLYGFRVNI